MRCWHRAVHAGLALALGCVMCLAPTRADAMSDRIVNGSMENFSYARVTSIAAPPANLPADTYIDVNGARFIYTYVTPVWRHIPGWNHAEFGWSSTQEEVPQFAVPAGTVQVNYDVDTHNAYAELAIQTESAIYQDVRTKPASVYKWRLKHSSLTSAFDDGMSVMIGAPGREQAQRARRTKANGAGDAVGDVGTIIRTHNQPSVENHVSTSWETYEGTYFVPSGQTTTRFTFKSMGSAAPTGGNNLDDIEFTVSHAVRFDSNGGSSVGFDPMANGYAGYVIEGESVSLASLTGKRPTRPGYTFLGWSEAKLSPFTSKDAYDRERGRIVSTVRMGGSDKTVYAVWGKNPTVTFTDRGEVHWSGTTSFGGTVALPQAPTRHGYTFKGWSATVPANIYSSWTASAVWVPNTYTITFKPNAPATSNGDGNVVLSMSSKKGTYDAAWGPLATATKPGYVFEGWRDAPADGHVVDESTICAGDRTVYAAWRPIRYRIVFHANGRGSSGETPVMDMVYDVAANLTKNGFERHEDVGGGRTQHWRFLGWSRTPTGDVDLADAASVVNMTKTDGDTIDLYAVWEKVNGWGDGRKAPETDLWL